MKAILSVAFAALLALLVVGNEAQAAVVRVVVIESTDMAGYLKELDKIRAINKRLGIADSPRAWRARFAGEQTGTVVVVIEAPDMATYFANDAKQRADAEFQVVLRTLDGLRKIVSDSLYEELN